VTARRAPAPPGPRGAARVAAWPLAWITLAALGPAACAPDRAAYDAAVARMSALDRKVDAAFDGARDLHPKLFAKDAWDDPTALATLLAEAEGHMADAVADQDRRVATEEAILGMDVMKDAAGSRLLYRMDLEAQKAKRDVFVETRSMYEDLARAVAARDPGAYARAAEAHGARIDQANARFRELDLARQRRQSPPAGP
jgi:hypothetical protein